MSLLFSGSSTFFLIRDIYPGDKNPNEPFISIYVSSVIELIITFDEAHFVSVCICLHPIIISLGYSLFFFFYIFFAAAAL